MARMMDVRADRALPAAWLPRTSQADRAGRAEARRPQSSAAEACRPPRILQVVECAATGVGRHVLDLTEGLLQRGCEVHVVYSPGRCDRVFTERLARLPNVRQSVVTMRSRPHPADAKAVLAVRRVMREHGPFDVVHCHSSKAGLLARFAASGLGARVVYTPHAIYTMSPNLSPRMRQLYQTAEVSLSWLTDKIIAVSQAELEECRRLGIRDTRLALVPNTVGEPNCLPREVARQQIGLRDEEVAIGFVGRLSEQKGIDRLLDCFARVPAEAPARLVVIGDGELASAARRQAETLGIGAKVLWLGARPAEPLLRAFDIFAMPSRYEAASYSLLEAMAAGLPVITTATGSASDLILDGHNGYCVPVEDVDRFGACLAALVTDGVQREAMAESARQPRRETAGVQQMVEDILSVYEAATPSRPSWRTATIDAT